MTITVRVFAMLRDAIGTDACRLALSPGARARQAGVELARRYPSAHRWLGVARPALNREYCSWAAKLRDGDELCLLPPVSGG